MEIESTTVITEPKPDALAAEHALSLSDDPQHPGCWRSDPISEPRRSEIRAHSLVVVGDLTCAGETWLVRSFPTLSPVR